jgi:acyl carrier protein
MEDAVLHTEGSAIDGRSAAREGNAVRAAVARCFVTTAADQERGLEPLTDELILLDSGLDSLCFAIIVAQLEDELGVDPFSELDDAFVPGTFGEFVRLYEAAVQRAAD